MQNIISDDCLYNILGHIKNSWTYGYPSGTTLENAIFEGLAPFYPNAKKLGAPSTIVDAAKDTDAFDAKARKELGHVTRTTRGSNHEENQFVKQTVPGHGEIIVKIPLSVITQVRRPKVNLKRYKGDPSKILSEQINDYQTFAVDTTAKDGYIDLYSIVLLYGIGNGYKSVFLTIEKFSTPAPARFSIGKNEKGNPCSYNAYDLNDKLIYKLSSYNAGSSNLYKRFETPEGILLTWPIEIKSDFVYTKEYLEETSAIKTVPEGNK